MDPRGFPESLSEFQKVFPNEAACAAYLEGLRFPAGFICQYCGWKGEPYRFKARPEVMRCRNCKRDTSLTAGTVMERTHTPLSIWFWGAYLVTTQTPGMSALQFQRQLGLTRYETAFQILHKLRAGMIRPDRDPIGAEHPVEIDEVFIGGKTRGHGRGVHYKAIVVGAVEVRQSKAAERKVAAGQAVPAKRMKFAGRLRLQVVHSRGQADLEPFVLKNIARGASVRSDGWTGYDHLAGLGYRHDPVVMGGDPERAEKYLPMIHLIFSNLKTWIQGTHHGVSQQHLQAYLNEYVFRFNRRFYPLTGFNSVLGIAVQTVGPEYKELYGGQWIHPNPTPKAVGR
jgi:hypothetical protein